MIPHRVVYEAYGHDVDTVIVDGKVVMEKRIVKTVDEEKALKQAQRVAKENVEANNLHEYMRLPERFWGNSKYQ